MGPPIDIHELARLETLGPAGYVEATIDEMLNVGVPDDERSARVAAALGVARDGFAELRANVLTDDMLTHVTVELTDPDGTVKVSHYRTLPTPVVFQVVCGANCQPGTKVVVTQHAPGGARAVTNTWPFTLADAEELVRPADREARDVTADGTSVKRTIRNFGRIRVLVQRESGPPAWRFPRIQGRCTHGDGNRYVTVRVGWRLHAFQVAVMILDSTS